jgi:hypothetical protein
MKDVQVTPQNFYVDLDRVGVGSHTARIEAAVPDGFEVVQLRPAQATVEVLPPMGAHRRRGR